MSLLVHVSIGEVKLGRGDSVLMSHLGSCVGIAFLWEQKKTYALAHCLLPHGSVDLTQISARFVNQAVLSLLTLMRIKQKDRSQIQAVLAGGGNMTAPSHVKATQLIGTLNLLAAEKYVYESGIEIIHRDVGGNTGKKVLIFCDTGKFEIKAIPRIDDVGDAA